jgi:hypothetical protein
MTGTLSFYVIQITSNVVAAADVANALDVAVEVDALHAALAVQGHNMFCGAEPVHSRPLHDGGEHSMPCFCEQDNNRPCNACNVHTSSRDGNNVCYAYDIACAAHRRRWIFLRTSVSSM